MSTVLWANLLVDGTVTSDESDKAALHRHLPRLDDIATRLGAPPVSSFCDTIDLRFNLDQLQLPDGMSSTNEYMALEGDWIPAPEAVTILERLLAELRDKRPRFGLLRNDLEAVISELEESVAFARQGVPTGARFNFSIVM